jgi:hypothetical protein
MIKIEFTKAQYEDLIKLVYLGNWMINAICTDDIVKKYDNVEQHIYSFAKDVGLDRYIEFDSELNKFLPTTELEEDEEIEKYREEYDDEIFWDEVTDRLAKRDFIKKYGENAIKKMTWKERLEKEYPFIEKYEEEFEKYGIENLEIKK